MRNLVLGGEVGEVGGAQIAEKAVQDRPRRFEVEALDVHQPSVAGGHQHRNALPAGTFAHQDLRIQRVALLDDDVQSVQKSVDRRGGDAGRVDRHEEVGVEFGDASGRDDRLVHALIEDSCGDAVEVRQLQLVEVCQSQFAAKALCRKGMSDRVADAESDDADPQPAEPGLLLRGDEMTVPVQSQPSVRSRAEDADHGPAPRVIRQAGRLVDQPGIRSGGQLPQCCPLLVGEFEELDSRIASQLGQRRVIGGPARVENDCPVTILVWVSADCHGWLPASSPVPSASSNCRAISRNSENIVETCFRSACLVNELRSHHIIFV